MLNRIVIINSEIYAKASVHIGDNGSIQIAAENNVGKSSFLNTLNFLYITDKDQMRFEDDRKLSDSMKHYFDGTSIYSFIVFEIFKNGYYCILVKATPENTIEYYKIPGEYREQFFFETSNKGFKPKKWETILQELTSDNPTDPPILLKGEDLYSLVYNSDKSKNPVVYIKKDVKRKGRSFSNSFTDIYKYLIKTSLIDDKAFKSALLVADNKQDIALNIFRTSSFDKINEFEKKRTHLNNLIASKTEFEKLKLLDDKFVSEELILGKLKNTFIKDFGAVEKDLVEKTGENSSLSRAIKELEKRIDTTLEKENEGLIAKRTTIENNSFGLKKTNEGLSLKLKEVEEYEPEEDHLLYQGLLGQLNADEKKLETTKARLSQAEQSQFTYSEITKAIAGLNSTISTLESQVKSYNNLLYHNISTDQSVVKAVYNLLGGKVSSLDKSKILKKITGSSSPLTFFDGQIDISGIKMENIPTIPELNEEIKLKKKELEERNIHLQTFNSRKELEAEVARLKETVKATTEFIAKIRMKPEIRKAISDNTELIKKNDEDLKIVAKEIAAKKEEIKEQTQILSDKTREKRKLEDDLKQYREQYQSLVLKQDIYQIEEKIDLPFESLYQTFNKTYDSFTQTRSSRKELKDDINKKLNKDIQDIKHFIREVEEEIKNIPEMEKVINNLLDTLSYEIGNPTHNFLSQFNDFKTFVYKSYNSKLAEYPISNIQDVKVKILENDSLVDDLNKISKLKFSNVLDFDNSLAEGKEALDRQLLINKGKNIEIPDLFTVKVQITKATGQIEELDLSKQVQSRGTNIVLKLYLFLNIMKDLVQNSEDNKIVIYIDELDAIGQKNVKHLIRFCETHHFVPIFAAPRKVDGINKYYVVKEPAILKSGKSAKITFGELQSFPVEYRNAEQNVL